MAPVLVSAEHKAPTKMRILESLDQPESNTPYTPRDDTAQKKQTKKKKDPLL